MAEAAGARPAVRAALLVLLLAVGAVAAGPATAQTEAVENFDPGAPANSLQIGQRIRPFDRYELPIGKYSREAGPSLSLEGAVAMRSYRVSDEEATTAGIVARYRERLEGMGFETIFACRTTECGGFDFRFAVTLLPAPAMLIDTADFAQLSLRRDAPGTGTIFVSVLASRVLGHVYVQTTTVSPGEAPLDFTPSPGVEAATEALVLPQDEASLHDRLTGTGHVRIEGLIFETGGTDLSPGSEEAIDRIARLLSQHAELDVAIVGHSDNRGSLETNLPLSRDRAEAVRAALVGRGVAADRLEAHGVGWLAPVASNETAAGRALNRRVELVLR